MEDRPGTFLCDLCGEVQPIEERTVFDGKELCTNCRSERTAPCAQCGKLAWADNTAAAPDTPLCPCCLALPEFSHCLERLGHCLSWRGNAIFLDRANASVLAADSTEALPTKGRCRQEAEKQVDKAYREAEKLLTLHMKASGEGSFCAEFKRHFDHRLETLRGCLSTLRTPQNAAIAAEMESHLIASPIYKKAREVSHDLLKRYQLSALDCYYGEIRYDVWDPSNFEEGAAKLIAKAFVRHGYDCNEAIRAIETDTQAALDSFQAEFNSQLQEEILATIVEPIRALLPKLQETI